MTVNVWKRFAKQFFAKPPARRAARMRLVAVEDLEPRLVMYATTGNSWPNPQVITIGFEPDGTNLGGVYSDLNSVFNGSQYLVNQWQGQILKAAQSWAQKTNINFVLITDNGADFGSGNYQQGDPAMADIRIGGFDFGNSTLARAYVPPPTNNFSIAGDIIFNTGVAYRVGFGNDVFTVAAHEFGHALGLDHSSATGLSVMWPYYNGVKTQLNADDTNGIRNIYSSNNARSDDAYESNNTFGTATNLTSLFSATQLDGVVSSLDITTTTDLDYFKFTTPTGVGSTLNVSMQSLGLSLLAPKFTVYASNQTTVLGTANSTGYGATLNLAISGLTSGQTYYIKAQGANTTAFGTGAYALVINMGTGANPTVTLPNTQLANGNPLTAGGGIADMGENDLFIDAVPLIVAVANDTGVSVSDRLTNQSAVTLVGMAPEDDTVQLFLGDKMVGTAVADHEQGWSFTVGDLADGLYIFTARGVGADGTYRGTSDSFTVRVDTQAPNAPVLTSIQPGDAARGEGGQILASTTIAGTAERTSSVTVFLDGASMAQVQADSAGIWTVELAVLPGRRQFTASATDNAGNTSRTAKAVTASVDASIAARASLVSEVSALLIANASGPGTPRIGGSTLQLSGSTAAGATVTISSGVRVLGTVRADGNGDWDFESVLAGQSLRNLTIVSSNRLGLPIAVNVLSLMS